MKIIKISVSFDFLIKKTGKLLFISFFLLSSCGTIKNSKLQSQLDYNSCSQLDTYKYSTEDLPIPIYELDLDTLLTSKLNFRSLNLANAIGITDLLIKYIANIEEYKKDKSIENQINLIENYQILNQKINFASIEISAISSQIDCEEDRLDQIARYIRSREIETESKLTVGVIAVGATSALLSGTLWLNKDESNSMDYIGVSSGLIEAGLGLAILLNSRKVQFNHPQNALKDIWEGVKTSVFFPPSIWYFLNYYNPDKPEEISIRYKIIKNWMSFDQIHTLKGKKKNKLIDMYFGKSGKYSASQLEIRADMYDQLESAIKLMKQDLKNLMIEIESLK